MSNPAKVEYFCTCGQPRDALVHNPSMYRGHMCSDRCDHHGYTAGTTVMTTKGGEMVTGIDRTKCICQWKLDSSYRPFIAEDNPVCPKHLKAKVAAVKKTYPPEPTEAQIDDMFDYHAWTDEQIKAGSVIREALANAVKLIVRLVPPGPDRSVAIRKIREARMDANSAITHRGRY